MRNGMLAVALLVGAGLVAAGTNLAAQAPNPIPEVRALINKGDIPAAEATLRTFITTHGRTPQALEALSWLGRGSLAAGKLDDAIKYAYETERLALEALEGRGLDDEPHLPIALGAAYEVQAQVMGRRGELSSAIRMLETRVATYRDTSIRTRLNKNINLLSLEGKPAPALEIAEYVGPAPQPLSALKGKAVLLFFWAHWCPDCKAMAPVLGELQAEYGSQGLEIVAPTQRYGYVAKRAKADAETEIRYIAEILESSYGAVKMPAPVSQDTFANYGSSTTPTIVMVNREGVVTLYHPGQMTREKLEPHVKRALGLDSRE